MSTAEKIENIKTEIEFLKDSLPAFAKVMPQFKKADELMADLVSIAENQNAQIIELQEMHDLGVE